MPLWNRKETAAAAPAEERAQTYTLADNALAEYLGMGGTVDAGVSVNESSALGLTAVWRSVQLISGTVAGLPLKTYRRGDDESRERIPSAFDNPGGDLFTPFEFVELVCAHLLLHGNAFLLHLKNEAGTRAGLFPIHPSLVSVEWAPDGFTRVYTVSYAAGEKRTYTDDDLTHVMGMSTDGLRGLSPISVARNAIGTGLAGDKAAARMFGNGMLLGGLVSSDEKLDKEQAEAIKSNLTAKMSGAHNAGDIAVVNASLKFSPWTMPAKDAQFIESRVHQIEEVARIFGVPPHLLGQTEKQTSWGAGVAEQNLGLARYTLAPWTTRIEQRLSRLLPAKQFVEFDYKGLLQPDPAAEIALLISQIQAGLMTANEARRVLNMPPLPAPAAEPGEEAA